ncbi:MAG: monovalent cation/H(+) antiporter subunit G [Oscillospiraceae bacterium]|nr:monovalent cation/H(+) antiporter subunit G [Oscillospiraceae bacterium]
MEILENIIIIIGAAFMLFGVVGLFRFKEFYPRILITSKIDTVGAITLIAGLGVKHGASFFTLKLALIIALLLILNPLAAQIIARSAYISDSRLQDEYDDGYGGI